MIDRTSRLFRIIHYNRNSNFMLILVWLALFVKALSVSFKSTLFLPKEAMRRAGPYCREAKRATKKGVTPMRIPPGLELSCRKREIS
jgi:hypothetical protein